MPNKIKYNNWKTITEADFVSMFIKTWFAYISTLTELHPEGKTMQGDGTFLKLYKNKFDEYFQAYNYELIDNSIYNVYIEGMKIISSFYPERYAICFFNTNNTFSSIEKSNEYIFSIKKSQGNTFKILLFSKNEKYKEKVDKKNQLIRITYDFSNVLNLIDNKIMEDSEEFEDECAYINLFYKLIQKEIRDAIYEETNKLKSSIPEKNNKRLLEHIDSMFTFASSTLNIVLSTPQYESLEDYSKCMHQKPINYYSYRINSEEELSDVNKKNIILWFVDFVYALRNALFHEIIDPLNAQWQNIFKNSYLALKEMVDFNIAYLNSQRVESN